ncbi:MAG: ATP-dependent DNA ligase, partial [Actinomycetota bacterium]|nr:ATP-dependent DNA ligase [Actinomycetota bacterium]
MPETIDPMSVDLLEGVPDDAGWASEIKWDGVRAIAFCQGGKIRLQGARMDDITDLFPEIDSLGEVDRAQGTILDGELVAFGEGGVPSFKKIQDRLVAVPEEPSAGRTFRS